MTLRIRTQQLVEIAGRRGSTSVEASLVARYPRFAALEPGVRSELVARAGLDAARYGLHTVGTWERYCVVAFLLGCDFDRDPSYPWARRILEDDAVAAQRAAQLHATCVRVVDRVAGPRGELFEGALRAVLALEAEDLVVQHDPLEQCVVLAQRIHPTKASHDGPIAVAELADHATRAADRFDVPSVFLAMFLLGVGVLRDPRHAWLERLLGDAPSKAPMRQAAVLEGVKYEVCDALGG